LAFIFVTAAIVGNTAFETSNLTGATLGMEAIFPSVSRNVWILILGIGGAILLFIGNFSYVEKFLTALVALMGVLFF
ncbi:divalent metal cation transporter, partial [Gemmiger formicilis]|uniref:divalent metal cation transporter n=2 Tax=Clostridia TaxID=186801 RepID=UPI00210CFD1C